MVQSLDPMGMNMQALDPFNMLGQGSIENFLNLSKSDSNRFNRSVQRAERGDVFLAGKAGDKVSHDKQLKLFESNKGKTAGQTSHVGPPSDQYSQSLEKAGGFTYQPIGKNGKVHFIDDSTGKPIRSSMGKEEFGSWMKKRQAEDPEGAAKFIQGNGLVQSKQGEWLVPVQQNQQALQQVMPGQASQNPISGGVFGALTRNSWALPTMGLATGGIGGLIMGLVGAKALKSAAAGQSAGGGNSLALMAPGMNGIGSFGMAGVAGMMTGGGIGTMFAAVEGAAYHAKKQMRAMSEVIQDSQMIAIINNPGIPIEDLIFMFMAHMGDKYERKLRDKMEEAARAEQRQTMDERDRDSTRRRAAMVQATAAAVGAGGGLLGGAANMLTGGAISQTAMAVGQMKASQIQAQGEARIMMRNAMQGHTKSSTILMQEVQMLMHKWKQMNELMSNLMKSMHDMAMTPIRNLR